MPRWKNLTVSDLEQGLVGKLSLEPSTTKRRAPHPVYWYVLGGKRELKVKLPNVHGGSGAISVGFLQQIRKSLRLTNRQFEDLVNCPLCADEFEALVREQIG
jgi:hypothetical protein